LDDDEQMIIPKPNYDAQKPEDVFIFDDSLYLNMILFKYFLSIFFSSNSY
jgi:hypothetical protein